MHTTWLRDPEFLKIIDKQIDYYFEINTNQTSASVRWEAFKAFIRGQMIICTNYKYKCCQVEMVNLENKIKKIESEIYQKITPDLLLELHKLKMKYNELSLEHAKKSLMRLKQTYYEGGERVGKLLAWRIKQLQTERAINSIQIKEGEVTFDQTFEINVVFRNYYQALYSSEYLESATEKQKVFLDTLDFGSTDLGFMVSLEDDLKSEELSEAIISMKGGKTPSPDGIPIELYNIFHHKLITAVITLLLKPRKSPKDCGSYRPISLLNNDLQILCKALAKRLEIHLPKLVHIDQNDFVWGRHGFHNIRRVLNILHEKYLRNTYNNALLSLDAEKAFDRTEWQYLFRVMERMGFGYKFMKWV